MAKTLASMLVGIAIAEGHIHSVDDPAAAYVPALADTEYGRTSLRHLLQMSSGVRFIEEYSRKEPYRMLTLLARRVISRIRRAEPIQGDITRLFNETVRQAGSGGISAVTPYNVRVASSGTRFYYASVETQVLGLVGLKRGGWSPGCRLLAGEDLGADGG